MEMIFVALNAGDVHLHFDNAGVNTVYGGAESFVEHLGEIAGEGNPALPYLRRGVLNCDGCHTLGRWMGLQLRKTGLG